MRGVGPALCALALCSSYLGAGQQPVTYTQYQFTCCTSADVNQIWQPGSTVELHWIVKTATVTAVNPTHSVVLTAELQGSYNDVAMLKQSKGATHIVQGSVIRADDRTSGAPITTFLLPADLPAGYYNLVFKDDFGGGNSMSAASIVRVGTAIS